ncbi:SPOSA6832_03373 [Sporobolomyces salmonicolor]|uniref:ER membrane protein complex subunit 4 n=1 Tax=Sporidiobolus salmonicolor TaxID=5005 RepID=A0A0D6EPF7_SPOSA|nr:SPOSA6832_03373 [Sporobolomyces salmonicolor]
MAPPASTSTWTLDYSNPPPKPSVRDPPGFVPVLSVKGSAKNATAQIHPANLDSLRRQKAWEVALAPAKSVPMQAFMMYMTGGGIQIFSVMSVWFLLKQAISGILSVETGPSPHLPPSRSPPSHFLTDYAVGSAVFAPFTASSKSKSPGEPAAQAQSFFQQKAVFVLCQIGLLCVGLWKCNSMGLLPTHESDWIAFRSYPEYKRTPIDFTEVQHLMGPVVYQ